MLEKLVSLIVLSVILSQQAIYGIELGIVQGVSEWLPISSKTQIIIFSTYLLKLSFNDAYTFGLFMEIGTIFAAIIYFRKEISSMMMTLLGHGSIEGKFLLKYVLVSTVFTGIVGVPIYLYVDSLKNGYNFGLLMVFLGILLMADAAFIKYSRSRYGKNKSRRTVLQMGIKDYVIVGVVQGIAALPGVSRSGSTTSALLLLNVETDEAFRLSFINMILATSGAVLITLIAHKASVYSTIGTIGPYGLLISVITATLVSIFFIGFLLNIAKKSSIFYLISALGIIALVGGILASLYGVA